MRNLYFLFILFISASLYGQSDLTLYHFTAVPQSLKTNPAMPQQTKVWVGLPALGGVDVFYHNSAFALSDLLIADSDANENLRSVIDKMDERTHLAYRNSVNLIGFGFKAKSTFWSFQARQVIDFRMDLNSELFNLLYYGNADNRDVNISDFDLEFINRTEYALGFQKSFNEEKMRLGFKLKYQIGQQHAFVDKMDFRVITTDSSTLRTNADVRVRTAGLSQWLEGDNEFEIRNELFSQNRGYGVDLGLWYQLNEKWSLSASVLDLGFNSWEGNTRDYISTGDFEYGGVDADLSNEEPIENDNAIGDSLEAAFNFQEVDGNEYTRNLNSHFYLGAEYALSEKLSVGGVYHGRLWEGGLYNDVGVNLNARLARFFQVSASYNVINGTFHNVGLGFDLKAGPLQLFVITDNLYRAVYYEDLESTNLNLGLNITLYGKKAKNKNKKPKTPEIPEAPEDQEESKEMQNYKSRLL